MTAFLAAVTSPTRPRLPQRALVVLAHPDDETLGCGALLPRLDDLRLVCVTDGAPRDGEDALRRGFPDAAAYAEARRRELSDALAIAGIAEDRCRILGVPDQGAADAIAAIARRLVPLLASADIVLTHAIEGGHPDHDAVGLAVRAAAALAEGGARIVEMPFYRAGAGQAWIRQSFASDEGVGDLRLTGEERALKARMMAAHRSQAETLAGFATDRELYRPAAPHDVAVLPNDGALLYERQGWGLDGAGWLARAEAARRELGLASWL